jgi:hypothetical protein
MQGAQLRYAIKFVADEVGLTIRHQWKNRRRNKIIAVLSDFMFKGNTLATSVPNPDHPDDFWSWARSVEAWRTDTAQYLNKYSAKASSAFLLITVPETNVTNLVHPLEGWAFHLTGNHREAYQALLGYLNNLRSLMEEPDVYF